MCRGKLFWSFNLDLGGMFVWTMMGIAEFSRRMTSYYKIDIVVWVWLRVLISYVIEIGVRLVNFVIVVRLKLLTNNNNSILN